jgi:predicted SAM-dependent methyltransferase
MESKLRKWIKANIRVGVRRTAKFFILEVTAALHTRWTALFRRVESRNNLRLNMGCGDKRKEGWVNIDLHPAADIKTDVRRKLPFCSNSACVIYSEHLFEHLEYPEEAMQFLRESHRVLAPGGMFSVGVPDTELVLRAYVEGDFVPKQLGLMDIPGCDTPMHCINYLFHQGGEHKHLYDFDTLAKILREAGFENVRRRDFDPELDSDDRRIGTLYVNAERPSPH